ncbi:MAG: FAD-binding oxidoreductase [Gemmatimonadetes bacterium]|nr:FAD-binding oxidoreductase [Gemmatimonadota bacterium]
MALARRRPARSLAGLRTLDVGALRGIVEYVPGDLTLTARASTTLAEIDEATRPHAQWLPLDPFAAPGATLGATLATASWGPLSWSIGLPRDLTIGLEFVDGRGIVVRGGGRVVKNVAGFDLVRLTVGAWGTLGIITEVSVRLRARPPRECTLALDAPRAPEALAPLLRTLRDAPLTPLALELVDGALARRLDVGNDATILVRLAGNDAALAAQRTLVESLGITHEVPTECWGRLQGSLPPGAYTIRASRRPSEGWPPSGTTWDAASPSSRARIGRPRSNEGSFGSSSPPTPPLRCTGNWRGSPSVGISSGSNCRLRAGDCSQARLTRASRRTCARRSTHGTC